MASSLERLRKARQGSGTSLASANIGRGTLGNVTSGATVAGGGSALARIRAARLAQTKPTLTPEAQRYAVNNTSSTVLKNGPSGTPVPTEEGSKNRGGLLGGIGYVGEKIGLGVAQGVEGIFDFAIGGVADIFGADDFAERQFANDWFNYSHADEWYNPGEGWKAAGDVAGGIGSSIPTIATAAAVTYFTGGAGAGIAATLVAGTAAGGTAVKEAYQETGKLTGKEWGYGILSGATEAAIEKISGGIFDTGASAIGKRIGQAFGKTAAKEAGKTTVKSVAKELGKDFLSEAFEEGFTEMVSPWYKRMTYDPNAKNATAGEIGYAALVGGISGLITSGAGTTVTQTVNIRRGAKAEASGSVDRIKAISEVILEADGARTDEQSINAVRELYHDLTEGSLKITAGEKLSIKQKRALGELQNANMAAIFEPKMVQAAANAVNNAEAIVERLNSYGNIKMADGKFSVISDMEQFKRDNPGVEVRDITAEDIRAGFDTKNSKQALTKAIRDNDLLRYVAASDVAGRLIMSVEQFEKTSLEGTAIKDQVALNKFIEEASPEKRAALGRELGIADNEWDTLQLDRFNEAVRTYRESGKLEQRMAEMKVAEQKKNASANEAMRMSMDEITDNPSVAGGDTSTSNELLYTTEAKAKEPSAARASELKGRLDAKKIDAELREKVEDYAGLSAANKSMIRKVVREGRVHGLSEEDILSYARVAARTGLNIEYDANMKDGEATERTVGDAGPYKNGNVAGYYDPKNNRIVVNPKAEKKQELILIHELDHAVRKLVDLGGNVHTLVYEDAEKKLSDETWEKIKKDYADQDVDVSREELFADEASAYYTEAILGGRGTVDLLLGKDGPSGTPVPTMKKILDFFTGAARAYSKDAKLSREARRHYKSFKAMFDAFAEWNKGRNAETAVERETVGTGVPDGPSSVIDTTQEKSVRQSKNIEAKLFEVDEKELSKRTFSYKELVAKGDLTGIVIGKKVQVKANNGVIDKAWVATEVKKKCETLDTKGGTTYFANAPDIGKKVEITNDGITHGFARPNDIKNGKSTPSAIINARVALEIPQLLRNSIEVNRSKRGNNIDVPYTHVMMGTVALESDNGDIEYYAVRSMVEERVNQNPVLIEANVLGKLYAVNAKKIDSPNAQVAKNSVALTHGRVYTYNIAQFLQDVKGVFDDTFSVDVYKQLGAVRKSNDFSKNLRFSKDITPKAAEESGIEKSIGKLGDGKVESVAGRDAKAGARRAAAYSRRRQDMTVGQLQQMVARYTGEKVYTSKEARETIENIAGIFTLSGKNRAKLSEALWQGYNSCKTDNERAEFSYDMAEYITVMMLAESSVANPDKAGALETLSKLKHGIGHLSFNDIQHGDLKHKLDKQGYKKFIGRWGFRETMQPNRRRVAVDVFIHNLAEENPEFAYLQDMTPQDAILELDRVYEQTLEDSKAVVGILDNMPDTEIRYMIDDIGAAIYESFSTKGEKSTAEKVIEARVAAAERKYADLRKKYEELRRKYYEDQGRPRKLLNLSYQIRRMKDLQLGTFLNATDYKNEIFKQTFQTLGSIEFRGNISPAKVRHAMQKLAEWYTKDNPVLAEIPGEPGSQYYSDWMALQINAIAEGEGDLTNFELDQLDDILRHATKIVENFNRVWKGGKWVKADSTAKDFIGVAEEANIIRIRSGEYRKIRKLFNNLTKKYFLSFGDPMSVFRYMDGYMPGFYTEMGEELRRGAFRYQVDMMEMKTEYDAFVEGNKKYLKNASTEVVEYAGVRMTKLQFMSLYMTMQRQQAVRGLAENGFSLIDVDGRRVEADGFLERVQKRLGAEAGIEKDPDGAWKVSAEQLEAAKNGETSEMKKKLSEDDLKFIGIIESTLNGRCKDLKTARDMERLGFSNTIEGYYYPIVRAMIAKNIDTKGMWGEIDRASNISANKETVKGAKGALFIESADTVFNRHIDAVARYAELSPVIDSINKLFNLDVSGNKNKPRSVRTVTFNAWQTDNIFGGAVADGQKHAGEAYLKELLADVQGIGKDVGVGERFVNGLRGRFAIAALSANPKVLVTQFSSVFASTSIISMKDITAGSKLAFDKNADLDVDKYCPAAKLRNYDSSAAKAQGVIDNISGIGEKLMWGVGFMDRQVIKTVWGGAQANIERTMGHKVGTEENKIEAGKLLEKIIFETQQNSVATEKSAAMRSKSAFMKTLTMFTSDAMKGFARVIDGVGRVTALKTRIKMETGTTDEAKARRAALEGELKEAMPQARAAIGALVMNAVYMTLVARLFSLLYAKEDEEEEWQPLALISDTFGNMLGGLPGLSDIYDYFTNGYEISDSVYDTINDVLSGTKKVIGTAADVMDGKATSADVNGALMSFLQVTGTALGLPVRNVRNMGMGLVRRFAPNAAYRMEMVTKDKNFASDFDSAIEAGDDSKASMILGLLLEERLGGTDNPSVAGGDTSLYTREALRMESAGYNVLPRTIGSTVTIAGEEVDISPEEQSALRARYSEAVGVVETLIASEAYAALSDEQRESAVRFVYDVYYDVGIAELYGYERNLKRRLFSRVISVEKLALANVMTAGLESDYEDEHGKEVSSETWAKIRGTAARVNYSTVQGSKRKKVIAAINKLPLTTAEKLLIIAYKGYTVKDGDIRGVSAERAKQMLSRYAKKAGLTGDEAKALESYL